MITINSAIPHKIGTVTNSVLLAAADYLQSLGIDPREICDDEELTAAANVVGGRIEIGRCIHLLEQAVAYTGDPDFSLKIGANFQLKHLGLLGFAGMSGQRLGDVIRMVIQFEALIVDFAGLELVEKGEFVELIRHTPPFQDSPLIHQQILACWVVMARQFTARPHEPADAHFSFPAPANTALYREIFGGQVHFDAAQTKIVFHKDLLDLPITQHDPTTHSLLMLQVEKTLQTLNQTSFLQKLREHIAANLCSDQIGIAEVASAFHLSVRTLQYQLEAEGYSYRTLVDKVKLEHAEHHLKSTDLSLSEIAFLLGYSEQSPFQSAFKRWTGLSPGEYRKKHAK
jgi:AraC-like DNA-binding protein